MNPVLWFVRLKKHTTAAAEKQENIKYKIVIIQMLRKSGKTMVSALSL